MEPGTRDTHEGVVRTGARRDQGRERVWDLFHAHSAGALRLAYLLTGDQETARDVTQDAFVRVFSRFRDKVAPEGFQTYLRRTVVNLCKDQWRRNKRDFERAARLVRAEPSTIPPIEERDEQWSALRRLPTRQRAALVLRYYEDLSELQTAEVLGCSVGAVKALVTRGRDAMRAHMEGDES